MDCFSCEHAIFDHEEYYGGIQEKIVVGCKLNREPDRCGEDEDVERCELCRNYHRLKHNFTRGEGFEESHCCDLWGNDEDGWIQEVTPNGMCEMFQRRGRV